MASIHQRQDRPLPVLAGELRTALTPVLGYLDLMLDADVQRGTTQQLQWIGSVERQLHSLRSLSEELIEFCGEWRAADRATGTGRNGNAAEAPQPEALRRAAG